jgi:hypothetical protein
MILLALIAWRVVAVPVSVDYADRMVAELLFETAVLYGYIIGGLLHQLHVAGSTLKVRHDGIERILEEW